MTPIDLVGFAIWLGLASLLSVFLGLLVADPDPIVACAVLVIVWALGDHSLTMWRHVLSPAARVERDR